MASRKGEIIQESALTLAAGRGCILGPGRSGLAAEEAHGTARRGRPATAAVGEPLPPPGSRLAETNHGVVQIKHHNIMDRPNNLGQMGLNTRRTSAAAFGRSCSYVPITSYVWHHGLSNHLSLAQIKWQTTTSCCRGVVPS